MADAPLVLLSDDLPEGTEKINKGISNANEALKKSVEAEFSSSKAINIANNAEITASTAEQKVDSVQAQLDQVVIEGSIDPETKQARVEKDGTIHNSLKEHTDVIHERLGGLSDGSGSVVSAFWNPPKQPPARIDHPGYFADGFGWDANRYISDLWEPLRISDSKYITRESLGKDSSNKYDIWKYEFTPTNYEKTMIIGSGLHGGEVTAMLGLYRFLYHVVNDWPLYPQLAYIRNKVKLIVLPIQNPWGMSQQPRTRQNSNGVDINRNFDVNWNAFPAGAPWDHDYKGPTPFSEKESQYIKTVLERNTSSLAYLDLHNLGTPDADFVVYFPKKSEVQRNPARRLMEFMKSGTKEITWGEVMNPSGYVYAAELLKMHAANPEFPDKRFGSGMYDSTEITKAVEWFGNFVLQYAKLEGKTGVSEVSDSFVVRSNFSYSGTGSAITFPLTNYGELTDLRVSFPVPTKGIVLIKGEITIRGTDAASQNFIAPYTGQVRNLDYLPSRRDLIQEVYGEGMQRQTLPFSAEIPVTASSEVGGNGEVIVGLHAKNTAGTVTVFRYHCTATFIPTNKKDAYRLFDATGRVGQGMIQTY